MTKYFIIGETNGDELWLVDVDKGTVAPVIDEGPVIRAVKKAQKNGGTIITGISIGVATNSRSGADAKMSVGDPDDD